LIKPGLVGPSTDNGNASIYIGTNGHYTGYNVSSGVEKTIATDSTCTDLKLVNVAGTTLSQVDVTVYQNTSGDIDNINETFADGKQYVNITHNPGMDYTSQQIVYPLASGYRGTPRMTSNDTGAFVSANATHLIITTGAIRYGSSYEYEVVIDNSSDSFIKNVGAFAVATFVVTAFAYMWRKRR